ncbi:MAG: PQQ-dependent sugar dehydrogenase [Gammaproteobacteria bacterium]|nr:PQQ-dependent sugar dehydrogenase [Gammaproteobacteria bacterium]
MRNLALILLYAMAAAACTSGGSDTTTAGPSLPSLSIADATVLEGDSGTTALDFRVTLSGASASNVSVSWATADSSATAGSDYTAASGTLTIAPGGTSATISVTALGDTNAEPDESLTVTLANASGATIADGSAVGTIRNDDAAAVFGLDVRPDNQTCVAPPRPGAPTSVAIQEAFPGLVFSGPTKLLLEPVTDPRWFVLQKSGQLRVFDPDNPVASLSTYLNLSAVVNAAGEGGLLGMAFHPDYPATPEIFLSYTRGTSPMRSVISRVVLSNIATPAPIGAGSVENEVISIEQFASNHNGGDIAFGPDGFLYIGLGDGGGGGDPQETGQNTTNLLGSFLRLDATNAAITYPNNSYLIPGGNPFAGQNKCGPTLTNPNNCPEIFAWGVRNPWRWSFDTATGELWAGDVGQGAREEIDIITGGNNYGWDCREGFLPFEAAGCNATYTDPVYDYPRSEGFSVTGGMVYRGSAIGGRVGEYIYADYGSGRIWALRSDGAGGYVNELLSIETAGPVAFAADAGGELYYANINNGRIYRLVPGAGGGAGNTIPDLLSDTGCVDPADITRPYAGLVPYDINARFWSDGAVKSRYLGLPNGTTMSIDNEDDWQLPPGTVIVKNFRMNGNLIETRHFMRHPDGVWAGYTYEWNPAQTEATRVVGGKTVDIGGQDWVYPSEAQCDQCHTAAAGFALGPETAQLNRDFTYPGTGRSDNQLTTLDHIMMFAAPLAGTPATLPALADPEDTSAALDDRARAYLHTNCANCHRPGGGTPVDIDLRYSTSLQATGACDVIPQAGDLGLANARIIAPGAAASSVLVERVNRRDTVSIGMPPLASTVVDTAGVALLTNWVNSLAGCL